MNILVIGGGVFLGRAVLDAALARGHTPSVFNRGRSRVDWPTGIELLTGDRNADLALLKGRHWDAVIDTCGYVPDEVHASTEALRESGLYLFVSSISAYATTHQVPVRETDPLAPGAGIARDDRDMQHYGAQKAACEDEVRRRFGERALIVRPGLIVGPGDRSGRFGYWLWRAAAGGPMLVPDAPAGQPLQFIDVRDLAQWMVVLIERAARGEADASGAFNATGPIRASDEPACDWQLLMDTCAMVLRSRGTAPATTVRVGERFLSEQQVRPWSELPLWLPSDDTGYAGFSRVDLSRAVSTGLATRPLHETIAAVLDEPAPGPDDPRRIGKLTREREAELLAAWSARTARR